MSDAPSGFTLDATCHKSGERPPHSKAALTPSSASSPRREPSGRARAARPAIQSTKQAERSRSVSCLERGKLRSGLWPTAERSDLECGGLSPPLWENVREIAPDVSL